MSEVVVRPNLLGKFFAQSTLTLTDENIVFKRDGRKDKQLPLASVRTLFQVKKRFLGHELRLEGTKTSVRYRFMKAEGVEAFQAAANKIIRGHLKAYLQKVFTTFNSQVKLKYPRDSKALDLQQLIEALHQHYTNHKKQWHSMLSIEAIRAVEEILTLHPFDMAALRDYHEQIQLKARRAFFDSVEANPLTHEQRLAVLRSNDMNMVLAAAGTGKTAVMVAKALDLIDRQLAKPSEILILAYNRTAALELKDRLFDKAVKANICLEAEPHISTFHALGRQLLQEAGIATQISDFAEDSVRLKQWVSQWLHGFIREEPVRMEVVTAMTTPQEPKSGKKSLTEQEVMSVASELLTNALHAIRQERLGNGDVGKRLNAAKIYQARKVSTLLNALRKAYVSELKRQNCIDFDDLIIQATNVIKRGAFIPPWKYVLVDEFQDISVARMEFIDAILSKGPAPSLTVVGDDWQSIYRFSGGKLALTTRFSEQVGSYTQTKLQKTFRYNNSIADIAGQFIMANPEQYRKVIDTHSKVDTPQVFLLDDKPGTPNGMVERVVEVVRKIRANEAKSTVAVIARYNTLLDEAKNALGKQGLKENVHLWSFHKSKGLEADHCILIGLSKGKRGFPSEGRKEVLIEALLPSLDAYPHAEERRLMYVGITRAKHKCYIIADPSSPSEFVTELLTAKYNISIASSMFQAQR